MNENLDLTKILDGCPSGTLFYHSIYGVVRFEAISEIGLYPIILSIYEFRNDTISVTPKGLHYSGFDGECVLFPSKDQRDWSKYERFWDKPKVENFDPKTLKPFDKVLVRDVDCYWTADIFSHIDNSIGKVCCSAFLWKKCVPYNDETKHLIGTTDDCPEFYKWWEE